MGKFDAPFRCRILKQNSLTLKATDRMAATINDVARRAGVAKKTVSRVINNEPHVRPAIRARVEAAIAELGFVPHSAAQRLASNRSFTIGVAVGVRGPDLLASALLEVTRVAAQSGYAVILMHFDPADDSSAASIAGLAQRRQADGLIVIGQAAKGPATLAPMLPAGFPWVQLGTEAQPGVPVVSADDDGGARAVTEHLLGLGHRRIGYVGLDWRKPHKDRWEGFRATLAEHAIPVEPHYVFMLEDLGFEGGVQGGQMLLRQEPRPTAICADGDLTAAGVLAAAYEAGLRVPDDLSVTGYDDFLAARLTHPPLTTVRVPLDEMSQTAAALLIEMINGHMPAEIHTHVPLRLVIRQSTGAPPRGGGPS